MPPARVRPAERPQRVHGHKHKLETTQVLPTLSQQFSHFFLLGASSPNARAVTTTSSLKEIQHQGQSRKEPNSGGVAQDDSTLPIPIPETGIRPTLAQVPGYPPDFPEPTLTISNTFTMTAGSGRPSSSTMRFSSMSTASSTMTTLLLSTSPSSSLSAIHSPIPQRTLSSTLIAVLAIGASCLVLFVFILIKICTRPRDRPRLTPSLPILDKKYLDELESKESPIFGGKERVSPNMGLDDEWMNGCYASLLSSLPQPLKVTNFGAASQIDEHGTGQLQDKASYPESGGDIHCTRAACNLNGGSSRVGTAYQAPYQQIQDAITQTMKRLSSVSLSLYPVSPRQNEVGIALSGQETPLTGDGYFHMPRSKSKICKVTDRQSWQFHGPGHNGLDDVLVALPKSSAQGGRTRIKSPYYTPGVHSRISVSSMSNSSSKPKKTIPSKGICQVPSCQTMATPYRDDMRGVQDSKDMKEETSEDQIKPANLLTPDPGATLGALLISEYPSEMNKSETYSEGPDSGEDIVPVSSLRLDGKKPIQVCRTTDKPPRVPSPPLLPSLTQMAMELHNREDFDNYRSPTYSIYGLYGEEGKSCGTSC
ncbi:hypothetical protein JOM56_003467 [Amanita muscaria]